MGILQSFSDFPQNRLKPRQTTGWMLEHVMVHLMGRIGTISAPVGSPRI